MTQGLDLLRAAAHEGDAIDLGQIGGGQRFIFVTSAIFKQLLSLTVYTLPQEMRFVKRIIFI